MLLPGDVPGAQQDSKLSAQDGKCRRFVKFVGMQKTQHSFKFVTKQMKPSKRLAKTVVPKIQMVMTLSACLLIGRNGRVALPCNATLGDKSKNPRLIAQVMFSHKCLALGNLTKFKEPCPEKEPTITNGRRKGWWRVLGKMGSHNPSLVAKAWCTSVSAINAIYECNK